jgi:hypothetical protein
MITLLLSLFIHQHHRPCMATERARAIEYYMAPVDVERPWRNAYRYWRESVLPSPAGLSQRQDFPHDP